jgi:hypothetical protein
MKNKKFLRPLLLTAVLLILFVPASYAASGNKKLLLFAKNPATWTIIKGGASGKMVYHETTGAFTLSAAGLQPRSSYALIRLDEAALTADILSRSSSDGQGRLSLNGTWRTWVGKFWVVCGDDVTGKPGEAGKLKTWRPDRYLFEEKLLGITCLCPEPEEP